MLLEKKMIDKCGIDDNIITDNIIVNINWLWFEVERNAGKRRN